MVSLAAVLVLVSLGAEPPVTLVPERVTAPPPGAMRFDELPPPPKVSDDARVKQFLGAFAGGAVGLGAALALIPAADTPCMFGFCAINGWQTLLGAAAPMLAVTGAFVGHRLLGGDGGWLTAAIMLVPGLLIASGFVGVSQAMDPRTNEQMLPFAIAAGAILVGGSAFALHARSRQLEALGAAREWGAASAGRVALTALVGTLAAAPAALVTGLTLALGINAGIGPALGVLAAALGTLGTAAAAWGVHRGMDGRGSFLAAALSMLAGWAFIGGSVALLMATSSTPTFSPLRNTSSAIFFVELTAMTAMFAPVIGLELSHTENIQAALPKFALSAAPLQNGGMVGASVRF